MRWRSWGSMAEGGKRYKDLKAAQSILRQSTAKASGWGKADTQRGRRWLIGDAIRSTSSGPAQRRIASNDNRDSVHSVFSGSARLRASATTLRAVGTRSTWKVRSLAWSAERRAINSCRRASDFVRHAAKVYRTDSLSV